MRNSTVLLSAALLAAPAYAQTPGHRDLQGSSAQPSAARIPLREPTNAVDATLGLKADATDPLVTGVLKLRSKPKTGTIGRLSFIGQDAAGVTVEYGDLIGGAASNTHGASVGALHLIPANGGAVTVGTGTSFSGFTDIVMTPSEPGRGGASGNLFLNKVNSTADTDDPLFHSYLSVSHSGGTHILTNTTVNTSISPGANPANVWSVLDQIHTSSTKASASAVAHYDQAIRSSNGGSVGVPLWAGVMEARSQTGLPSSRDGIMQPLEIDLFANGPDDFTPNIGRTLLTLVLGKSLSAGSNVQATAAINFTEGPAGSNTASYKSVLLNDTPFSQAFLDNRGAIQMAGANSIWLATGQTIAFDTAGIRKTAAVTLSSNGRTLTARQSTSAPSSLLLASPLHAGTVGRLSFMGEDSAGTPADYGDITASAVTTARGASVGMLSLGQIARLARFTVATLPACGASTTGAIAYVTDAASPTYNGALTGGGSVVVPAFCNGSAWTAH